jgi:hypothetical protein
MKTSAGAARLEYAAPTSEDRMDFLPTFATVTVTACTLAPESTSSSAAPCLRPPPRTRGDTCSERMAIRWVTRAAP